MTYPTKILVDTNILLNTVDKTRPNYEAAINFLDSAQATLVLSHQNICEYIRVSTHATMEKKLSVTMALENVEKFKVIFTQIIYPNAATLSKFFELTKKYDRSSNKTFDTYLVATAISNGINSLATFNTKDFQEFTQEGISIISLA